MRVLNDYGMMRLAQRLRVLGGFPSDAGTVEILNGFQTAFHARYKRCPFTELEAEGSVEKPANFGLDGKPALIIAEGDWFHREPDAEVGAA